MPSPCRNPLRPATRSPIGYGHSAAGTQVPPRSCAASSRHEPWSLRRVPLPMMARFGAISPTAKECCSPSRRGCLRRAATAPLRNGTPPRPAKLTVWRGSFTPCRRASRAAIFRSRKPASRPLGLGGEAALAGPPALAGTVEELAHAARQSLAWHAARSRNCHEINRSLSFLWPWSSPICEPVRGRLGRGGRRKWRRTPACYGSRRRACLAAGDGIVHAASSIGGD